MKDPRCDVEVGVHPSPFWIDKESGLQVCNRHKQQYDELEDSTRSFVWEKLDHSGVDFTALLGED